MVSSVRPRRGGVFKTAAIVLAMLAPASATTAYATHIPVENQRTSAQGMPAGRDFGYQDGYRDGSVRLYRSSYHRKVTGRIRVVMIPWTPQVPAGSRYIDGYHKGYDVGYRAGRSNARRG